MIDVAPDLHLLLPDAYINGQVSRQMAALPAVIAQLSAAGELSPRLVIELGTNGPGWSPGQVAAAAAPAAAPAAGAGQRRQRPCAPDWPPTINQELDQLAAQVPAPPSW